MGLTFEVFRALRLAIRAAMRAGEGRTAAPLGAVAAVLLSGGLGTAQIITTYAGNDALFTGSGQQATAVQIAQPAGVAVDKAGNVYIAATGQSMVLKVAPSGVISIAAGNGLARYSGDGGLAVGASLSSAGTDVPSGLAVDSAGNLYIADQSNNAIRRVDTNGIITTVAGTGAGGFSGDGGPATKATLAQPSGITVDSSGNLYIADTDNYRIRMVTANGIISTLAGNGTSAYSGDGGPAVQAALHQPTGVALDAAGNVYVADLNNCVIRKIAPSGIITTVAGTGVRGFSGDGGPATKAMLSTVADVKLDSAGNLYISDYNNQRIRRVDTGGIITTIAGTGQTGFFGDGGPATAAQFNGLSELAIDSTGAILVADTDNNRIRRIVPGGAIGTIAGQTLSIGDGGPSTLARLTAPGNTAIDAAGNLYIADTGENRIRMVTPAGTITTAAGTGAAVAESGDGGPAIAAQLRAPYGVAVDAAGNLYIADAGNNRVRKVNAATGIITVLAGNGGGVGIGDGGPALAATLAFPKAVGVDGSANVYITVGVAGPNGTGVGESVRRITTDGKINTYAGGGAAGFGGDGGLASQAALGITLDIAVASDGTLYIADSANSRVRRVDPTTQIITTVAGNGKATASGNGGPATAAGLPGPASVAVDRAGNLYVGGNGYVRRVDTSGIISAYAGNGQYSFSGDNGPTTSASMTYVAGLSVDSSGNLYITDEYNNRIRIVQPATDTLGVSPASLTFTSTGPASQTFAVSATGSGTFAWAAAASTSSGGAWLSVSPSSGASERDRTTGGYRHRDRETRRSCRGRLLWPDSGDLSRRRQPGSDSHCEAHRADGRSRSSSSGLGRRTQCGHLQFTDTRRTRHAGFHLRHQSHGGGTGLHSLDISTAYAARRNFRHDRRRVGAAGCSHAQPDQRHPAFRSAGQHHVTLSGELQQHDFRPRAGQHGCLRARNLHHCPKRRGARDCGDRARRWIAGLGRSGQRRRRGRHPGDLLHGFGRRYAARRSGNARPGPTARCGDRSGDGHSRRHQRTCSFRRTNPRLCGAIPGERDGALGGRNLGAGAAGLDAERAQQPGGRDHPHKVGGAASDSSVGTPSQLPATGQEAWRCDDGAGGRSVTCPTGRANMVPMGDLRYAARLLKKSPGFTLVTAGLLAIGIGASSLMFSAIGGKRT